MGQRYFIESLAFWVAQDPEEWFATCGCSAPVLGVSCPN